MANQLFLTIEGPRVDKGAVPLDHLIVALQGIQEAMQLMVRHLREGDHGRRRGPLPKWVREQSALRLVDTRPGPFTAVLELEPAHGDEQPPNDYGTRALDALLVWDGGRDSTLPKAVADRLWRIPASFTEGTTLWLGDEENHCKVKIIGTTNHRAGASTVPSLPLYGWLHGVNLDKRTARLYFYGGKHVSLRFGEELDDDMRQLATRYVEIIGKGRFNKDGNWTTIRVERIAAPAQGGEPFDLDAFRNNPNPKVFRSSEVIRSSEPFDVDEFLRGIREARGS